MYLLEDPKVHVFRRDVLMADTSVSRRKVATGKEDIKSAKIAKVAFAKTYSSCKLGNGPFMLEPMYFLHKNGGFSIASHVHVSLPEGSWGIQQRQ